MPLVEKVTEEEIARQKAADKAREELNAKKAKIMAEKEAALQAKIAEERKKREAIQREKEQRRAAMAREVEERARELEAATKKKMAEKWAAVAKKKAEQLEIKRKANEVIAQKTREMAVMREEKEEAERKRRWKEAMKIMDKLEKVKQIRAEKKEYWEKKAVERQTEYAKRLVRAREYLEAHTVHLVDREKQVLVKFAHAQERRDVIDEDRARHFIQLAKIVEQRIKEAKDRSEQIAEEVYQERVQKIEDRYAKLGYPSPLSKYSSRQS